MSRTLITVILAPIIAITLLYAVNANAHGWYSQQCCSNKDCEAITFDSVQETADGWWVSYHSKLGFPVVAFTARGKERDSQDGQFHACANQTRFLCLYVPVNS